MKCTQKRETAKYLALAKGKLVMKFLPISYIYRQIILDILQSEFINQIAEISKDRQISSKNSYNQLSPILFMLQRISHFAFCVNWSSSPSQVLESVKKQIKRNPSFVKQNGVLIIHHLSDLIESARWNSALYFLKQVNTNSIDRWELWQQFAKVVKSQLPKTNSLSFDELIRCLRFIHKARYEPNAKQDKTFYDNIQQLVKNSSTEQIIALSAYTLSSNPDLFRHYGKQLQQEVYNHALQNKSFKSDLYKFAYIQGILSKFWEQDFIQSINQIQIADSSLLKYFAYTDPQYPTLVKPQGNLERTTTERKIGQMILDLGYVFKENVLINGIQVDFLIGKKLILQYNGMFHYKINSESNKIDPIHYEVWRTEALEKAGYIIAKIPFYEWEKLQNEKVQKFYLIQRIERTLLENARMSGAKGMNSVPK